jgi:hypothetical protein
MTAEKLMNSILVPRLGNIKYWISVSSMLSAHLDWELMKSQLNCSPTEVAQSHPVSCWCKNWAIATSSFELRDSSTSASFI